MNFFFFIITICFVIAHTQNDLISPTFPDMIKFFNTNSRIFHLMSSSYSLGVAIGSLFLGSISDYSGRKKTLLVGLLFLVFGCFCSMLTSNIYYLIFFRFLHGIGTSAPMVVCIAIIFDVCNKEKARTFIGLKNGILTFGKAIAPVVGGYLGLLISWQFNFLLITIFTSLSILLVSIFINETGKFNKNNSNQLMTNLSQICKNYIFLLSDKLMLAYLFALGFMACSIITFTLGASIIYINHLNVSKSIYGYHQGGVWAVFVIFCFLTHYIIKFTNISAAKKIGFTIMIIGCTSLNYTAYIYTTPHLITLSMMICSASFAILITILFTDAMSLHPNIKGASSSIIASTRTILVTISIALAGYFF
ncbi:MFS transporter [Rickettsiales endosymbiont of Trichoplax sp. H2]|uniref:MFS transporter n=1 Tax=Rickettsiales endosymbiont of Trichoplax sp. H2 TaxID=2021221 RepID=UPI0012B262D8|nr:MFS transporter [Rickettsiales endosymbiont of Trichoplax sp. H2]